MIGVSPDRYRPGFAAQALRIAGCGQQRLRRRSGDRREWFVLLPAERSERHGLLRQVVAGHRAGASRGGADIQTSSISAGRQGALKAEAQAEASGGAPCCDAWFPRRRSRRECVEDREAVSPLRSSGKQASLRRGAKRQTKGKHWCRHGPWHAWVGQRQVGRCRGGLSPLCAWRVWVWWVWVWWVCVWLPRCVARLRPALRNRFLCRRRKKARLVAGLIRQISGCGGRI